jgi:hypothetical protein
MRVVAVVVVVALAACNQKSSVSASAAASSSATSAPAVVVDDATVPACTLSYSCGLSHPGLGSSSRTTTIDFATCTRTTESESGPWSSANAPPPRADASARSSTKSTTKLSSADCARVRAALTAVTQADAKAAQESAQMDTEACGLTLQCKGDPAPRLSVQRQSTAGPSRVEMLIRAVLGMGS